MVAVGETVSWTDASRSCVCVIEEERGSRGPRRRRSGEEDRSCRRGKGGLSRGSVHLSVGALVSFYQDGCRFIIDGFCKLY